MIKVMVVYDEDPLYAGRLAEYVNQKETFPFQAMAFSDLEKLKAYGRDHEIAILLVGERVREEAKEIKAGLKMLLCDGEFVSQEEASVYKFQSGDCILQEVMACYCTVPPEPGLALMGKRALIMGIYSPIGRCGKTSFSLTLAHMLGKSQGVLFISLEEYSGFSKLVCGGYEQDLSDVFYLYRQGDFNWLKLKSLILSHGNVDYIPPAAYGEDLDQAQPEEIAGLLKQIGTESGYERIVVDMGHMGAGAAGLCAYTFYRSVLAFLFLLPVAFLYPVYKKKDLEKERIRRLTLQFKEGIMVLASFLSAGYSLENSLSLSVKELEGLYGKTGMITEEFSYMEAGVRMNRPVELLLADMGRRSGIQDVDQFAQVFAAAKRSGGELTDIISQTAGIIRDKIQVQEEIHTLTAARVFEQKIMNGIPFGIILYIDFTSPGFFHVMYETWLGRIFMTACLGIYVGAVFLAKKILDIPL